ncbi:hypothetical protein [Nocardia sp. alder85J]|uniref:hypothetical protein n=1 Tax=Nocardia sp. alder85J TaxID=2862949 RepID=UPI001CD30216|nr:hypothetical protein [Nocardia sp. alder85J]MCX4096850.1 hypothetical protein [Nocardia sp. alder85J]
MPVLALDTQDRGVLPLDRSIARSRQHILRYRLAVVAQDATEIAALAGGWLFDRGMAGWDVTALVADTSNSVPLRILGATVVDLASAMAVREPEVVPHAFAVSAAVYAADERVRRWVLACLDGGRHEVTLWGPECPAELDSRTEPVAHTLSLAARAFKARALAAVDPARPVTDVEYCRSAGRPHLE